ncbi:MAG: hypothetical protein EHM48_07335 [Planctomycetaceae bacterium]|nr:MAG: hypothetical protein EHM48_07335 [Planctomycetaceae bacterium]
MATVEDRNTSQILADRKQNHKFLAENYGKLREQNPGKYLVVANGGAIVRVFATGEDAMDFCETELDVNLRASVIIRFMDMPTGIYAT